MGASYPGSEASRARARDEATQIALETVAEGGPLAGVLEFLCHTLEAESVDRVIACIHPVDEDATKFLDTVAPSLDKNYRDTINGIPVSSMIGPCCHAVTTRQTVVVPDLAADPKWARFQEYAGPYGFRSSWSRPILSREGKVLGTFAHFYFEARDPSPRDERMVELLIRAAAVAIERSRAEAALRELNETLEQRVQAETQERLQIWNVSQDLLAVTDLSGKILSINPAWNGALGWSEMDLLDKSYEWLLHPDDREKTHAEVGHLAKGQKTLHFENRLRAKDGFYHWLSWTAAPDGGRIYATGRDITEHKRAEFLLAAEKQSLEMINAGTSLEEILNNLCNSIDALTSGAISTILMMEPESQQLTYVAGPRVRQSWLPVLTPRPIGPREGCCGTAAYRKQRVIVTDVLTDPVWPDDYRGFTVENGIRAAWSEPILTKDDELLGTFALYSAEPRHPTAAELELIEGASHIALIAISQQRSQVALRKSEEARSAVQAELAHANRIATMGQLTTSIAHEVMQPMATARNNARIGMRFLEMTPPNLEEAREALGCVVRDIDRAKDIVGRIRDHIKKAPPRRESFDLNEAVKEMIAMVRSAIAKNRIAVSTQLEDGMVPVQGDRVQLQQVVANLILNAVEAMSSLERGARELSIRIEQAHADGGVLVQVCDSGPGIDPGNVERVFEPFYTTKTSGIGMGLSICRSIINDHGGRLWVGANEPRGAIFQFILPPA